MPDTKCVPQCWQVQKKRKNMFRVSQEIRLNESGVTGGGTGVPPNNNNNRYSSVAGHDTGGSSLSDDSEIVGIFGKYRRTPDVDCYPTEEQRIFVAPELTDTSKLQLLHFPNGAVRLNSDVEFITIKRNGIKGNIEVKLESPAGVFTNLQMQILDPERVQIACQQLDQAGLYKLHIKCNSVPLPRSPFIIVVVCGSEADTGAAASTRKTVEFK